MSNDSYEDVDGSNFNDDEEFENDVESDYCDGFEFDDAYRNNDCLDIERDGPDYNYQNKNNYGASFIKIDSQQEQNLQQEHHELPNRSQTTFTSGNSVTTTPTSGKRILNNGVFSGKII